MAFVELNSLRWDCQPRNKISYSFIQHIFKATLKFMVKAVVLPYLLPRKLIHPYHVYRKLDFNIVFK